MSQPKIFRKTFALSLAILLTAAVFAGCGKKGDSKDGSAEKAPAGKKEVSVDISDSPAEEKTIALPGNVKLELVRVEAGTFEMSAEDGENWGNEVPHRVTLTRDFYIGKTEVTQAQWKAVMGTNPSEFKGDDLPVENVSWNDAMEFCGKLNDMEKAPSGWKFTLPTETQWEYAARGGKKSKGCKYSGSDNIGEVAWYDDNSGFKTHPVGQKKANELGLHDMSGNVCEWCLDDWQDKSDKVTAEFARGNNRGGSIRVIRGGSWIDNAGNCRSANRSDFDLPLGRNYSLGFRLALVPAEGYDSGIDAVPVNTTRQKPSTGQTPASSGGTEQRVQLPPGDKTISLPGNVNLELVKVEAGSFEMSARDGENYDKEVAHRATLTKDFYIGRTEVTQVQWKAVMGSNPSYFKGDDLPVEKVSWNDAMEFCDTLNRMGKAPKGWKFTLPTETQWEYAARGGRKSKGYKYSGSDNIGEVAWYDGNSGSETHPVGQKKANELGLYDMSGNVHEWCLDDWNDDSSKQKAEFTRGNDQGGSSLRVFRGGSGRDDARLCRSAVRVSLVPGNRYINLGFRVALVPESY